jgi:hypothetical protein
MRDDGEHEATALPQPRERESAESREDERHADHGMLGGGNVGFMDELPETLGAAATRTRFVAGLASRTTTGGGGRSRMEA